MTLTEAPCKKLSQEDKDKFFPPATPAFAKKFCRESCPVETRRECLELALSTEDPDLRYGTWGGLSAFERVKEFGGRSA